MKLNRKIARLAASVLATAMFACATALPAMAEVKITNGVATANGDNKVTLSQTIDISDAENATSPKVTFTYTIAPNSNTTGKNDAIPVHEGVALTPNTVLCAFNGSETDDDGDSLLEKTFTIDFKNVDWSKGVGVYRYTLTQTHDNQSVNLDTTPTRYLDVYVGNGDTPDSYKVLYYVLTTDGTLTIKENNNAYDHGTKSDGFTADYNTYTLTVKKYVTGDMGSKDDSFNFTVSFNNLPNGVTVSADNQQVAGNVVTKALQDQGKIVITGIPAVGSNGSPVSYTVSEKFKTSLNYSTKYEANHDISQWNETNSQNISGKSEGDNTVMTAGAQNMQTNEDNCIEFNNSRNSVTPTGVIMNVAPYVLMVGIAVAGCFVFLRKRRDD